VHFSVNNKVIYTCNIHMYLRTFVQKFSNIDFFLDFYHCKIMS